MFMENFIEANQTFDDFPDIDLDSRGIEFSGKDGSDWYSVQSE